MANFRRALLLMKEDIRTSGLHEPDEVFRRDILTSTTEDLGGKFRTADQVLNNGTLNTNRTATENVTNQRNENKVNVSTKVVTKLINDFINTVMPKINNTRELKMERIPSVAYKNKLKINNITFENTSNRVRYFNESVIIKQTLEEIMNLNVSLDKREGMMNSTLGLKNVRHIDENSKAKKETGFGSSYLNFDITISNKRRNFELDSLRSLYTKDGKSEKLRRKEGNAPTEMEAQEKNNHHKGASTSKLHVNVSMDKEILNIQRREFVLDSLKSIYTKNIRKDFNLTTERNVNMTLYTLPFNFKGEEESAPINETTTENKYETTNISKGSQKLNAVLSKIPEIISKINKTLENSSAANHTFHHGPRAVTISSLKSELTGNVPRNINLSAVNIFKNATSPAMEESKLEPNNSIEMLLESKSKINMTKVQETTTVTSHGRDRRRNSQEDSGNIKSVIDLGVLKRLMEAARKNKKVHKIPYKTSTVDPPVSFGAESSERNFVNVWRETYLKPKAILSQKTGALINLIKKLDWKLAKSDKKATENIYGPAADQSQVRQFRRTTKLDWIWISLTFNFEDIVVYTNDTASEPFNVDSNFMDPLLSRNHMGSLYKNSNRWHGHYTTTESMRKKRRTPSMELLWRRHITENPEVEEEFRKRLHKRRKRKKSISTSTSSSESSSESSDFSYSDRRDGEALLDFDSGEETLEKDNKKLSQARYKKEEINVEPDKHALKRPEQEHDDDEHDDDYVRGERVQKENKSDTMQEEDDSQEELRPITVEGQQAEEEKQEILNPTPPMVGRSEKQKKYVQQNRQERQERQERSERLEKEQKPERQEDTYEQETRPNQLKPQERAENSKRQEKQETEKRPEWQGISEEQGSTKEQWRQIKTEKSHGQQRPEWSEAQEKPERSEEQPWLVRPQVQKVPERQERLEGYQRPERQESLESTLRKGYERHKDHNKKYDKHGHENKQKEMSQERPSRLQAQERLQKTEKDRDIKNEREEDEHKLIKFGVVLHDSGTPDHLLHSIKKNIYSGETSLKKDTLEDDKISSKVGRKMKKPLLSSKEGKKLGKEEIGWASGEKNKDSWEKNDKKNDDWTKRKDDDWDNKKDVDWDNKKDDSWSNKKVNDWDKKKDDDLNKRKGDDWDKKKVESGKISENLEEKDFAGNNNYWDKPRDKNKDSWDKKTSINDRGGSMKGDDDWGSPKKSKVDNWDSPKQSKNDDWDTPKQSSDDWELPRKSKIGDWDSPKQRKKDNWDEPIKLKDDEWELPKKSKHNDWESPKKSKINDGVTTKNSNIDNWDSPKKANVDDWDSPKKSNDDWDSPKKLNDGWGSPKQSNNDRGAGKKIGNDRPKSDNNRQKANWERPPKDDMTVPLLPRPKYKKSKFNYGSSLQQYGYMHTPIPFSGKKVIYDDNTTQ